MGDSEGEPETDGQLNPTYGLYLHDLHLEVTDGMLHDKFSTFGNIKSIKIFQDFGTAPESLGHAYIKYQNVLDAERAMVALNTTPIMNKPLQITRYSEEKPVLGAPSWPNIQIKVIGIFICNLDPSTSSKDIYDAFSALGGNTPSYAIIKSLISVSKTQAFLYFGMSHNLLTGDLIGVNYRSIYFSEEQLVAGESILCQGCTGRLLKKTVIVQNFPETYTEEQLKDLLSKYGEITSCHIYTDELGISLCGGFVSFVDLEHARTACEQLNGTWIEKKQLSLSLVKNIEDYKGILSQDEEMLYDKFERRCNAFKTLFVERSKATDWKDPISDSIWFALVAEIKPASEEFEPGCF